MLDKMEFMDILGIINKVEQRTVDLNLTCGDLTFGLYRKIAFSCLLVKMEILQRVWSSFVLLNYLSQYKIMALTRMFLA